MVETDTRPSFDVRTDRDLTSETLVCGFSEYGLAGLTAVDYLVDQTLLEQVGHVATPDSQVITPFEEGRPRRPLRLFDSVELPVSVLMSELLLYGPRGHAFADSIHEWVESTAVSELVVLAGVPVAHGPDDHRTFYVATEGYERARLADAEVPAMGNGFLDGVRSDFLAHGMDGPLDVCVYVTPVHAQAPDVEASLRLVDTLNEVYDVGVDTGPLESFAADLAQHYRSLADQLAAADAEEEEVTGDDRMYM